MRFQRVLRISRPRFWIYELGPYMIGLLAWLFATQASFEQAPWLLIGIFALYFVIPANIWIYGINDIYDYETDKLNPKKQWYEALVEPREHKKLWAWILLTTIPFVLLLPMNIPAIVAFILFLFFSGQYSAKPIRAKGIPIIDTMFSAGHYIATAAFGFLLVAPDSLLNWSYLIAGIAWAMAMHAFSAVPDIKADKDGGVATVATLLWAKPTIVFCLLLYALAGLLAYWAHMQIIGWLSIIYVVLMWFSLVQFNKKDIFFIYKWFPWINTLSGMILFFLVLLKIL